MQERTYNIHAIFVHDQTELPLYLLLGVLSGGVSVTLVKGSAYATAVFENVRNSTGLPTGFFPPVGGLAVGVIALAYPEILYWGFENVDVLLESRPLDQILGRGPSVELLLQLVGVKVIATSLCRGSGLVGGMYAPSLFIGAALGSAYGSIARTVFSHADPVLHLEWLKVAAPQAYALVSANCFSHGRQHLFYLFLLWNVCSRLLLQLFSFNCPDFILYRNLSPTIVCFIRILYIALSLGGYGLHNRQGP